MDELKQFLKEKHAYNKWKNNALQHNKSFSEELSVQGAITLAFAWNETEEGVSYWDLMSKMWSKKCRKLPLPLTQSLIPREEFLQNF